jgi:predicted lipoprotein with Yx(FWY)xxD motif
MQKLMATKLMTLFGALVMTISGLAFQSAGTVFAQGQNAPPAAPLITEYTGNTQYGAFLVDPQGMPLYVEVYDFRGRTYCISSACSGVWIPYTVQPGAYPMTAANVHGKLGTLTRPDGTMQLTYNNLALYTYTGDTQAGVPTGVGINNVWYLAAPDAYPGNVGPYARSTSSGGAIYRGGSMSYGGGYRTGRMGGY